LSGETVTILTPTWPLAEVPAALKSVHAGINSRVDAAPSGLSILWWWRTGCTAPSRKAVRSVSTSPGKVRARSTSAAEMVSMKKLRQEKGVVALSGCRLGQGVVPRPLRGCGFAFDRLAQAFGFHAALASQFSVAALPEPGRHAADDHAGYKGQKKIDEQRQRQRQRRVAGVEGIDGEGDQFAVGHGQRDQDDGQRHENHDEQETIEHDVSGGGPGRKADWRGA